MSIHYPKGVFLPQEKPDKMPRKKDARAANRGMGFEDDINATNEIYLNSGRALIYKRTTPINRPQAHPLPNRRMSNPPHRKNRTLQYPISQAAQKKPRNSAMP